jgi:hypothetical protein
MWYDLEITTASLQFGASYYQKTSIRFFCMMQKERIEKLLYADGIYTNFSSSLSYVAGWHTPRNYNRVCTIADAIAIVEEMLDSWEIEREYLSISQEEYA